MPTPIPRPDKSPEKHTQPLPQDIARDLRKGIPLESEIPWSRALRFALVTFPLLWLLFAALGILWMPSASLLLWSLGLSAFFTLLASLPFLFFTPLWTKSPLLQLQGHTLSLQKPPLTLFSLDMNTPFAAALLYREDREDALLVLQRQPQRDACFLYGRFRMRHNLPKSAIPINPLGFSLAEQAIDHIGAHIMPDNTHEYLPWITQEVFAAPGHRLQQLRLPLQDARRVMRVEPQHLVLVQDGDTLHRFALTSLHIQAYRLDPHSSLDESLLIYLSDDSDLSADPSLSTDLSAQPDPSQLSLWLAIQWPLPLHLHHLPPATPQDAENAIRLTWLDTLLLLHALHQRGVLSIPFSLFQSKMP